MEFYQVFARTNAKEQANTEQPRTSSAVDVHASPNNHLKVNWPY